MICPHCSKNTEIEPAFMNSLLAETIIWTCADHFQVPVAKIRGKDRHKEIVKARHLAMYFIRHQMHMGLKNVASHFGKSDHTTVIHAIKRVNDALFTKTDVFDDLHALREKLTPKLKAA